MKKKSTKQTKNPVRRVLSPITNVWAELRLMVWPTPKEWLRSTFFVILSSALIVLIILTLDVIFYEVRDKYLLSNVSIWESIKGIPEYIKDKF